MRLVPDILASYRAPRKVVARRLAQGAREDLNLIVLMLACALIWVAQWPVHARAAYLAPEVPLAARLGGAAMAVLFMLPLLLYGLAAIAHLAARLVGGQAGWGGARFALFWALLAAAPLWLLNGLTLGLLGPGGPATLTGLAALGGFLIFWAAGVLAAEFPKGGP